MGHIQVLSLQSLSQGLPAITPAFGAAIAEAGAICLTDEAHEPGVILEVEGEFATRFQLNWHPVTEQARRCWNDEEYTTEQAAYGIAILSQSGFPCPFKPTNCPQRSLLLFCHQKPILRPRSLFRVFLASLPNPIVSILIPGSIALLLIQPPRLPKIG